MHLLQDEHTPTNSMQCPFSPSYIMVDEIQVVSGSNGHGPATSLDKASIGLVQRLVHVDKGIDDSLPVGGRQSQVRIYDREASRAEVLQRSVIRE